MLRPRCSRSVSVAPVSRAWFRVGPLRTYDRDADQERSYYSYEKRFGGQANQFPDFITNWNRNTFYKGGALFSAMSGATFFFLGPLSVEAWLSTLPVAAYWLTGFRDMRQTQHTIRRNFPVLGNIRYIFETIRPEIRQYFIEADTDAVPFSRENRSVAYARAKSMTDTLPFGTRRNVYSQGYEWVNHSIWPSHVLEENERTLIGGKDCRQKYSACLLNCSGMSFGAISQNAILALNKAAKMGNFYQNTGEGSITRFHLENGGDIVWNIGTGYFGCRDANGNFSDSKFRETATLPAVKMIEIKLSQGAKPAHGGMLPKSKLTKEIAEARGVPMDQDCISPARHSAFSTPLEFVDFIDHLRSLSDGKPVGFKLCVGRPEEFAALVQAMLSRNVFPDFITVDGGEGGTGAAPQEFSNHIGMPLAEGLTYVDRLLTAAAVRNQIKLIASGKVLSGFTVVRTLALGADLCNSARAMMFALGCIQALKCNTNKCPTGIATQDPGMPHSKFR
jgi:glutamate synthase domain-containing protein 2